VVLGWTSTLAKLLPGMIGLHCRHMDE
jgi:hypothetical protein